MPRADRTRHTRPRPRVSVPSRPSRYLDRTSPRQSCGRDHAGALRVITRAEVAEEYNGLTHHCDDHGYGYGDSRTVLLHVAQGSAFGRIRRSHRVHNVAKRVCPTGGTVAIVANPSLSDRALAAEIGVSHTTVQKGRQSTGNKVPVEKHRPGRQATQAAATAARQHHVRLAADQAADFTRLAIFATVARLQPVTSWMAV